MINVQGFFSFGIFVMLCVFCEVNAHFSAFEDMPFDSKVTDTLHSLRSIVNRLHDVEFLRSLADNSDEVLSLGGGSVVSADYTNVSETCRDHWNRTITALNLNEYWALKSKIFF